MKIAPPGYRAQMLAPESSAGQSQDDRLDDKSERIWGSSFETQLSASKQTKC